MEQKFIKITEFLSVSVDNKYAEVKLNATIPNTKPDEVSLKAFNAASLCYWESRSGKAHGKAQDNVTVPEGALNLAEDRYVYKDFRALSQIFLNNRGLDFSRPGVLKASVELLKGKTVYANHDFRDIDNWRGVIADAVWDEAGANSNGVPGINVTTKVDAFLNYRTACGLMMTPPAINACSATVVCEVELSHPELVKNGTFWEKFGEEVDGEIVRLIAVKIIEFWELSFVFLGEDRLAKPLPDPQTEETLEEMTAGENPVSKLHATEKNTMKITEEHKTLLGISADGDDVPEQIVLDAALEMAKANKISPVELASLRLNAKAGETLLKEKRTEVTRLATLAELGTAEGKLDEVLAEMIENADDEQLVKLEKLYRKKVGDKLPVGGQSSLVNSEEIQEAAGVGNANKPKLPKLKR